MKDMNFNKFCDLLRSEVLEFKTGAEWDNNEWNDAYIDFKETLKTYKKKYITSIPSDQLAIEWARDFYIPASWETHNYRVVKKIGDWYCAETTKPEYNVGVLVFIPAEDNHITSGMWDISKTWVLLDEYRDVEGVTHWQPLPSAPKTKSTLRAVGENKAPLNNK